jgi:hypothetical protein
MELAFSSEQVADLRQWNLIDEQIAELERNLPRIKAWLKPTPASNVREALDPIVEAIENLERELKAVALPMPEKVEAFARLNLEADRLGFPIALPYGEGFPAVALATLKPLLAVAKGAREERPEGRPEDWWGSRRYPATADARVILWISNALSMGWGKGEIDGFIQHMPKHHVPSHTNGFKAIASVVYSACLDGGHYDAEEAIKRFRKQDREARENSRGAMNEGTLES